MLRSVRAYGCIRAVARGSAGRRSAMMQASAGTTSAHAKAGRNVTIRPAAFSFFRSRNKNHLPARARVGGQEAL